jgi:hypothetical protein
MAFDIGQRVTSNFTGAGTITGELIKLAETDEGKTTILFFQEVLFDNPTIGARTYEIKKLDRVDDGPQA